MQVTCLKQQITSLQPETQGNSDGHSESATCCLLPQSRLAVAAGGLPSLPVTVAVTGSTSCQWPRRGSDPESRVAVTQAGGVELS